MGDRPEQRKAWPAARRIIALTTVVALLIAPVVVILTHGPAIHAAAAGLAAEVVAHGHAHGERRGDIGGGPFPGHDATDHEHQLNALAVQPADPVHPIASDAQRAVTASFQGLQRDGPKRPPRAV